MTGPLESVENIEIPTTFSLQSLLNVSTYILQLYVIGQYSYLELKKGYY